VEFTFFHIGIEAGCRDCEKAGIRSMFKTILKAREEHAFSLEIIEEFLTMVEKSEEMLDYTFKILIKGGKGKKAEEMIYLKDQAINFTERSIRKRILVHLSVNPNANLPEYLALISIAKDAERLGDYVKNMFELKQLLDKSNCDSPLFETLFIDIGDQLLAHFKAVSAAFRSSDRDAASLAINRGNEIAKTCENFIVMVIETEKDVSRAVVLALGARYMKRLARHLGNIASSVVNPMPDLDFAATSS
jgi:phosphate uptake regulator